MRDACRDDDRHRLFEDQPEDIQMDNGVQMVKPAAAEVFFAALDNGKSDVSERQLGTPTKSDQNLETTARQAARDDRLLAIGRLSAVTFLTKFFAALAYQNTIFQSAPTA